MFGLPMTQRPVLRPLGARAHERTSFSELELEAFV